MIFLAGLEENLFPHAMSIDKHEDLEEERRLCYVAMTRARERLLLSHAQFRRFQGVQLPSRPSRFLGEIPLELLCESAARGTDLIGEHATAFSAERPSSGSSAARARSRAAAPPPVRPVKMADPGDGFPVGAFVLHPSFGGGQIVDREGKGKNLKLKIHFADFGPKTIVPHYTKLRVQRD